MSSLKVGVLGGGQLGRMFVADANRLNIHVNVLDVENAPARQISAHDGHVNGKYDDAEAVEALAKRCDVLTVEIEHVNCNALEEVAPFVKIEPSWRAIKTIQDKFEQKNHLSKSGIPMADYRELKAKTAEELGAIGAEFGYPFMLKARTQAYDGRGNYRIQSEADFFPALKALEKPSLYAERWAKFRMEVAVIVVKTKDGVLSYPTVETVQENSICKLVYARARGISPSVDRKAQELAKKAVSTFDGKGVFGVEMFLMDDDSLLLCELACRVHNSGHFTIEGCYMSQFEAHLRAILDLPIPPQSLELRQPAIMLNLLGGSTPDTHLKVAEQAYDIPHASVHLYGKGAGKKGRKMGHVTVTARTMHEAEALIQPLIDASQPPKAIPSTVGVIMGSDSDLATLVPGLKLLEDTFGIKADVQIVSAHRTPALMGSYAASAASRGIMVIIAAAGGAAHLPGMVAAQTALPVIGVPVKGSALDGVDSLHSIVQMPRGVPVATVGIGNSVNAALLAARILGAFDAEIQRKVEEYAEAARLENLEVKGSKMKELGWRQYFEQMKKS